jgi:hypothetical protein
MLKVKFNNILVRRVQAGEDDIGYRNAKVAIQTAIVPGCLARGVTLGVPINLSSRM